MARITKEKRKALEFYKENEEELKKLIEEANIRWETLKKLKLPSRAIDEALESRKREYFRESDFQTKNALLNYQRLMNFLNDPTSEVEGASYYKKTVIDVKEFQEIYGKPWTGEDGEKINQYKAEFDSRYGEEFTSRVYANYRRVEGDYLELLLNDQLPLNFDSESLITLMFDVARSDVRSFKDETDSPEYREAKDVLNYFKAKARDDKQVYDEMKTKSTLLKFSYEMFNRDEFKKGAW